MEELPHIVQDMVGFSLLLRISSSGDLPHSPVLPLYTALLSNMLNLTNSLKHIQGLPDRVTAFIEFCGYVLWRQRALLLQEIEN